MLASNRSQMPGDLGRFASAGRLRAMDGQATGHSRCGESECRVAARMFFAHSNFCRVHSTIETTPAVVAGLASEPWTLQRLIVAAKMTNQS